MQSTGELRGEQAHGGRTVRPGRRYWRLMRTVSPQRLGIDFRRGIVTSFSIARELEIGDCPPFSTNVLERVPTMVGRGSIVS